MCIRDRYWGKPITGYGDQKAKLLMVGLAPAAHGGNRTGRVFTGDKSADFLFSCLYKTGFANQPNSTNKNDGLVLKSAKEETVEKIKSEKQKSSKLEVDDDLTESDLKDYLFSDKKTIH